MIPYPTAIAILLACLLSQDALGQEAAGHLVFAKRSRAEVGTYVAGGDGQNLKKILFLWGPDVSPRFSPDGRRILFARVEAGRPWMWTADREGQDRKAICEGDQGTWSPDGSMVFFRRDGRMFQRDLASREEKAVSAPGWRSCAFPDCSPDGKRLLFCAATEGRAELWVTTLEGWAPKMIADLADASPARWSPDGRRIAYSDGVSIFIANADGGGTYALDAHGGLDRCPAWSPDGTMLIYCHAPAVDLGDVLCLAKADGTSVRLLPKGRMTEPGRDGLLRSNPRVLPYDDNALSVFAPDWRAVRPVPLSAAPQPAPRICIWDTGGGGASARASWQDLFKKRASWKRVSETTALQGVLAMEDEREIVLFAPGRRGAVLFPKPVEKQAHIVELIPVSEMGEAANKIESIKLMHSDGEEAVVELVSATPAGPMVKTSWKLGGNWPVVEIAAVANARGVRIAAPLSYGVVPDRFADDLLYDPASYAGPHVALPIAPVSLGLLGSGDAELAVVCPSERQTVDLLKDAGRDQLFSGAEAHFASERLSVGLLAGPGLWHVERAPARHGPKFPKFNWEIPGPGAWRLAVRAGGKSYSEMLHEKEPRRLEGVRGFSSQRDDFTGGIELAIVYLYGGSPETPPENLAPADLALHGMGMARYLRAMDIDGLQGYRAAPRQTTWADIFSTLESIRYLYDNEVEQEEKAFLGRLCGDVPALVEGMDSRMSEFAQFARQVAEAAKSPEPAKISSLLAAIKPALDQLEGASKKRGGVASAAEAAAWAAQIHELAAQNVPDKKKRFSELWQRLSRAARGRADLVRACRGAVRRLRDAAGLVSAESPELRPAAARLRELAQGVLRNRYYVEGDWRGELQREPPNWLGPTPY